ncbi:SPFH domain-containing protein [Candidatus Saccharibacteria bacterium]|nr:SPFH domain-containing protein [Candidatus Saccharibacteria bacterium]
MAFLKAFGGAISGAFANQWLEYMAPPKTMTDHTLIARAVPVKVNGSENNDGEEQANLISNGSKFMVPEGTCLITVENGAIVSVIAEPGGYTYTTENIPEARSMFAGDGFFASTFGTSFKQFKFGGQPGNQQQAYYVNLKDIMGLHYGTQNPIRYTDGKFGGAMLAVTSNGDYTIKVVDPILMFKNLIPVDITSGQGRGQFDLGEGDGGVEESLFSGFVGSLATALSAFTKGGKSIDDIQGGTVEFAKNMNEAVEANYQWGSKYGLAIVNVQPRGLDWDQNSADMVQKFTTGMMMQGSVGAAYAQTQIAEGFNAAGQNGAGVNGMAMGVGMMGGMQGMVGNTGTNPIAGQPQQPAAPEAPNTPATPAE